MRVLILSPQHADALTHTIASTGDTRTHYLEEADLLLSFNHPDWLRPLPPIPCINVHIALLPYNRGNDPNFWSWFDDTPKGVSIHYMDSGLDTGPIVGQAEVANLDPAATLATTYAVLQAVGLRLLSACWPRIRAIPPGVPQARNAGSYHRRADKDAHFAKLPLGWHTPVSIVQALGEAHRARINSV